MCSSFYFTQFSHVHWYSCAQMPYYGLRTQLQESCARREGKFLKMSLQGAPVRPARKVSLLSGACVRASRCTRGERPSAGLLAGPLQRPFRPRGFLRAKGAPRCGRQAGRPASPGAASPAVDSLSAGPGGPARRREKWARGALCGRAQGSPPQPPSRAARAAARGGAALFSQASGRPPGSSSSPPPSSRAVRGWLGRAEGRSAAAGLAVDGGAVRLAAGACGVRLERANGAAALLGGWGPACLGGRPACGACGPRRLQWAAC